mgnify:CR=1 FL=1
MQLKYKFYLEKEKENFSLNIDAYKKNQLILKTGIKSKSKPLSNLSLISELIKNLFFSQKIMILIHYQKLRPIVLWIILKMSYIVTKCF